MESDPVMSGQVFPAFRPKSMAWWSLWLLLSIQIAVILNIMAKSFPNSDQVANCIFCILAIITGWVLPSSGKKKYTYPVIILSSFIVIVFLQSHAITNILRSFSLLIIGISEQSTSAIFTFHITSALQSIWQFIIDVSTEIPHVLINLKSQAILFQFSLSILLWISFFVTASLIRFKAHALIAFIPMLLLIVLLSTFTIVRSVSVITTLSILLVSLILVELIKKEIIWKNSGIDYSPEIRFDTLTLSFPIIILTILSAGLIPEIDLEDIRRKWDELTEKKEEVANFYDPEAINNGQMTSPGVSSPQKGVMPRSHLLGSGPELSTREVMTFQTNDAMIISDTDQIQEPPRYYLTGSIYDYYTGKGWLTSSTISSEIQPNQQINSIPTTGFRLIMQTIEKKDTAPDSVVMAGSIISVNVPTEVNYRSEKDLFSAVTDSRIYSGYSLIILNSEEELRGYQEPVPVWILDRYLQIPNTFPNRTRQFAQAITSDKETSYDKALAIQSYLRSFPYSLDLPQIPDNSDVIDYFLFDLQKGYCDYFASAMVMLARANGIPARLVVGFTSGIYDFDAKYYIITEENAHAWPELYFSSSGWIPFEPTSNLPIVKMAHNKIDSANLLEEDLKELAPPETSINRSITYFFLFLGILVLLFSWWLITKYRKTLQERTLTKEQQRIVRYFKQIVGRTRYLGINYQASMTPLEFLDAFRTNVNQKYSSGKSSNSQFASISLLDKIVNLYNVSLYNQNKPQNMTTRELSIHVRKLYINLLRLRFLRRSWT